jgi:hypothetical protein
MRPKLADVCAQVMLISPIIGGFSAQSHPGMAGFHRRTRRGRAGLADFNPPTDSYLTENSREFLVTNKYQTKGVFKYL